MLFKQRFSDRDEAFLVARSVENRDVCVWIKASPSRRHSSQKSLEWVADHNFSQHVLPPQGNRTAGIAEPFFFGFARLAVAHLAGGDQESGQAATVERVYPRAQGRGG